MKQLTLYVVIVMVVILVLNYFIQARSARKGFETQAAITLLQIDNIIKENDTELAVLTQSLLEAYEIRALAVAYIVEQLEVDSYYDYVKIADLLSIDEIHIFNEDGVIYEGSVPKYYGYSFDSGEQMAYFKPLLEDKTLIMTQDITPNTAEGKSMVYIATWTSDGEKIVQIGIEPERILEEQEKNELDYIFVSMPFEYGTTLMAIDEEEMMIVGSTNPLWLGRSAVDIGFIGEGQDIPTNSFYTMIDGDRYLCLVRDTGDTIIVEAQIATLVASDIAVSMSLVLVYLLVAAFLLIFSILHIIDYKILRNIDELIDKLTRISGGKLDTQVDITTSPEFESLSKNINTMVANLLNTTSKLSGVLEAADVKMAVYEYRADIDRVLATSRLVEILGLSKAEGRRFLANKYLLSTKINEIKRNVLDEERKIYCIKGDPERYVSIEMDDSNELDAYGVIVDVTDTILLQKKLERERDYDMLTDLYNRRAFGREMDLLFGKNRFMIKQAVLVAFDMDNLKVINDKYGHLGGDLAIQAMANIFKAIDTDNKIVARLGGDEFMALIYGEESREDLDRHLMELKTRADNAVINVEGGLVEVHFSAGYVYCSDRDYSYSGLMSQSDEALYEAKKSGKAKFCEHQEQ